MHNARSGWTAPRSFVAIGDSFSEGLDDPNPDGSFRGWADRLAGYLAAAQPGFRYANLAVRGKLLGQVITDQIPQTLQLRPELVSFAAGGNDLLRPGGDPDALAARYEQGVRQLRAGGSEVLVLTGCDIKLNPLLRRVRGKLATYNAHLRSIADRHNCLVLDLWGMEVLNNPRAWSVDRLHPSPEGHQRVALRAAEVLGIEADGDWDAPWPPAPAVDWVTLRRDDLRWAREFLVPWISRRIRGRSSGDGVQPKRPDLVEL